ncbi:MAG: flagellar type III secretion system pore protein FliP [Lachnospiraceae bacterium]|nr:flagellar type III secretion system pore protein FliP [Lachnospiraceae bacterium]
MKKIKKISAIICLLVTVGMLCILPSIPVHAQNLGGIGEALTGENTESTVIREPGTSDSQDELGELNIANSITITQRGDNGSVNGTLRILITLTLIGLAPIMLIMLTSFTRIIIVLHFTRAALSTQTAPPNQVLVGLALFLTYFIMRPTIAQIYTEAIVPFDNGTITQEEFFETALDPLREFMYGQTQTKDVNMFLEISGVDWDGTLDGIPNEVLIPSFVVSELRTAFIIGFLIYIPFIVIDMVVASALMSMGMMMLPPTTISMPFKILLFVLADGWNLIIGNLVKTFY